MNRKGGYIEKGYNQLIHIFSKIYYFWKSSLENHTLDKISILGKVIKTYKEIKVICKKNIV